MSHRVARIDEIPAGPAQAEGIEWRPVRNHLGITAFGTNAYVGRAPGDLVIEDHDEDEHEELYVVLSGAATFTVDGETFGAPQGTLVLVTPPSRRVAHATAPDTTILAIGAPREGFSVSEWETRWMKSGSG
jgi:mannose-6-phosphate isomerase-like protein (cupin superfamily)